MKGHLYILLFFIVSLLTVNSVFAAEVEKEVLDALHHDSEASVIVILKDEPGKTETTKVLDDLILSEKSTQDNTSTPSLLSDTPLTDYDFDLEKKFSSIPSFSGIITKEGLEKLKQELEELRTTKRQEIAQRLHEAASHGDLSENSE
mgnify:CR=1 FL=1